MPLFSGFPLLSVYLAVCPSFVCLFEVCLILSESLKQLVCMMAENVLGDCNPDDGKRKFVVFSEKEEHFVSFQEQFEARMYKKKLLEVLQGGDCEEYRAVNEVWRGHEANAKAKERAENIMQGMKWIIWCEIVQALDKKNVLYLRPYKGYGPRA